MKIRYRKINEYSYTEVEAVHFIFVDSEDGTSLELFNPNDFKEIKNVCEVYVEEL